MIIRSEAEFLELVERIHRTGDALPEIQFKGWPSMSVAVSGKKYNATLTPGLLQGLMDFQTEFYRAYAQIKYGSPNLQRLTSQEKRQLELLFTVEKGSTENKADISDPVNHIFDNIETVLSGMDGSEKLALYIVIALGISGYFLLNRYLEYRENVADNETTKSALQIQKEAVVEVLEASSNERLNRFIEHSESGYSAIVQGAPDATSIRCGNHTFSREEIAELASSDTVRRSRREVDHFVVVESLKRTLESISFTANRVDRDNSFTVKADLQMLKGDEMDLLYTSLKSSRPIRIKHYALMDGDDVAHSTFMAILAEEPEVSE